MAFLFVFGVAALVIAWLAGAPLLKARRRRRLREKPFPPAWRSILRRRVPLYLRLPTRLRRQLEGHVQVFLAEKGFSGCDGQEIDDEVRVTIAAQACLLLLDKPHDYFPRLHQVLVYPGAFIVERLRPEPSGVLQETRQVLSGESWSHGQVVLSWESVLEGAAIPDDGRNVVIHEFAHQLDQEKGFATARRCSSGRSYARWSRVMARSSRACASVPRWARPRSSATTARPTRPSSSPWLRRCSSSSRRSSRPGTRRSTTSSRGTTASTRAPGSRLIRLDTLC
jgi:Mlc titration factor MtfA (ptsG expression regulator)